MLPFRKSFTLKLLYACVPQAGTESQMKTMPSLSVRMDTRPPCGSRSVKKGRCAAALMRTCRGPSRVRHVGFTEREISVRVQVNGVVLAPEKGEEEAQASSRVSSSYKLKTCVPPVGSNTLAEVTTVYVEFPAGSKRKDFCPGQAGWLPLRGAVIIDDRDIADVALQRDCSAARRTSSPPRSVTTEACFHGSAPGNSVTRSLRAGPADENAVASLRPVLPGHRGPGTRATMDKARASLLRTVTCMRQPLLSCLYLVRLSSRCPSRTRS